VERKVLRFEVKDINEEEGIFTGYASTFTDVPDSYGDVVDRGAFKKTLKEDKNRIKHLWNHSAMEPIGKPLEISEDEKGLLVKGKLSLGVQRAREVLALMKDGVINEMSIGYDTITEQVVKGIRHLKEVKLYDVSPVTFAANPTALIIDVKAVEQAIRTQDLEPVREAVKALQALLSAADEDSSDKSTQEPAETTPEPEGVKEAADMEELLNTIEAEIADRETKGTMTRLNALLDKVIK